MALAVNQVLRERDRAFLAGSTATSDLTGRFCAPLTVQWTFDTWALANGTARALPRGANAVVGEARPLNTTDHAAHLVAAQASGAKVVALTNAGTDATNATIPADGRSGRCRRAAAPAR